MTEFFLSGYERLYLEHLVEFTQDSRQVMRAYTLLWLDDGDTVAEIAARLGIARQTVYNWAIRFQTWREKDYINCLADAARSGRPCTATNAEVEGLIAAVIESDPRELEYNSTVWTAQLLVQYLWDERRLSISDDSVRRIIARLEMRWKRPRHCLALRSPTWRQAKGG